MDAGIYDMVMKVYYGDKVETKTAKILITREPLRFPGFDLNLTNVLLLAIIVMVLTINIVLFILLTKKKEEHENEKIN